MPPSIQERLADIARHLMFLGKPMAGDMLIDISVILRCQGITGDESLIDARNKAEKQLQENELRRIEEG